jgi:hypothetical protein
MRDKISLKAYGYSWEGMQEITYEQALAWFDNDKQSIRPIYLLYQDNTEGLAISKDEVIQHYNSGGRFGVEIDE